MALNFDPVLSTHTQNMAEYPLPLPLWASCVVPSWISHLHNLLIIVGCF